MSLIFCKIYPLSLFHKNCRKYYDLNNLVNILVNSYYTKSADHILEFLKQDPFDAGGIHLQDFNYSISFLLTSGPTIYQTSSLIKIFNYTSNFFKSTNYFIE